MKEKDKKRVCERREWVKKREEEVKSRQEREKWTASGKILQFLVFNQHHTN